MDQYTERTTTGLGSRLIQSIKGVIAGVVFFLLAFPLLWWNEGRAVRTARSLDEGAKAVVSVGTAAVDAANEGRLVHATGRAETTDTVADPEFGVSAQAVSLRRKVEMYQWKESSSSRSRRNTGGSETTTKTYKYDQVWSESSIDSAQFKKPEDHQNPPMPFGSSDFIADNVKFGAFRLTREIVGQLTPADPVDTAAAKAPAGIAARARKTGSGFHVGDPASPQTGDLRIAFTQLKTPDVSVVARQVGDTFAAYQTKAGGEIQLVAAGVKTADSMFASARTENTIWTWILRGIGFLCMFLGLALVLKPLSTVADVVPVISSLVRGGAGLISFVLALCFWMVTIATAWIAHRPLVGIGLLAGALLLVMVVVRKCGRRAMPKTRAASA